MISANITKNNVLKALQYIDKFGVPKNRDSTKYSLEYKGNYYPPKYVISIANKFANKYELEANEFGGGNETNGFLTKLGFNIYDEQGDKLEGPHNKIRTANVFDTKSPAEKIKTYTSENKVRVATVLNSLDQSYDEFLLDDIIIDISKKADIILFAAGFFDYNGVGEISDKELLQKEKHIVDLLKEANSQAVVCLGLDVNNGIHQLALAINDTGIIAKGRKFYPTDQEKGYIKTATSSLSKEENYDRIFKVKNKSFYLAVCYDVFGIRKNSLVNPGVDCVLNLIHGFYPRSEGRGSGDVYFARLGLAGASKQWGCPVFAATTYYRKEIPKKWPSGVLWNQGKTSVQTWSYSDNIMSPIEIIEYDRELEKAEIRIFEL